MTNCEFACYYSEKSHSDIWFPDDVIAKAFKKKFRPTTRCCANIAFKSNNATLHNLLFSRHTTYQWTKATLLKSSLRCHKTRHHALVISIQRDCELY